MDLHALRIIKLMNSPAQTACWPMATVLCWYGTNIRTDNGADKVKTSYKRTIS